MKTEKPDYIEIEWRIRCDGWWRKALICVALVVIACGGITNLVKIFTQ